MRKVIDRDLVGALALLVIGAVSVSQMGTSTADWAFPRTLTYTIIAIAVVMVVRVLFRAVRGLGLETLTASGHGQTVTDVLVFSVAVLAYVLLISVLGFWLDSFLMLVVTSVYLTTRRNIRSMLIAAVVAAGICALAYFIFLDVFYIPFPSGS